MPNPNPAPRLDCAPYESLMVGLFQIFGGFVNANGTTDGNRTSAVRTNSVASCSTHSAREGVGGGGPPLSDNFCFSAEKKTDVCAVLCELCVRVRF